MVNDLKCIARHTLEKTSYAEYYASFGTNRLYDMQFRTVFSNLNLDSISNQKINALDIGCSGGRYTSALLKMGTDTVGLDTAINALLYASNKINATFICGSATDLPFKKGSFDLVLCVNLLHHFTDDINEHIFREINNVIKSGGICIFDVKNALNPVLYLSYKKHSDYCTYKSRTTKQMTKLIEKHGFKVIQKKGVLIPITLFAPFVIVFARKEGK
jgi:SAM-dependent methyltransferase